MIAGGAVVDEVSGAALLAEAVVSGYGFEQRRLSRSIFSSEEAHTRTDFQCGESCDGWNGEGIGLPIFDALFSQTDLLQHGFRVARLRRLVLVEVLLAVSFVVVLRESLELLKR